jgi:hypothetical protein
MVPPAMAPQLLRQCQQIDVLVDAVHTHPMMVALLASSLVKPLLFCR